MASESKPMDIEEEVEEIDQEIKKPEDEGRVPNAERELNYQRKPSAEDLKAPDVFSTYRKETLPIYRAVTLHTPTGMPSPIKTKKPVLPKEEKIDKPEKGTFERHILDNPNTKRYNYVQAMLELKSKIEGMPSGGKEKDETLNFNDDGTPDYSIDQLNTMIAEIDKKLVNWNAIVNKKPNAKSPKRLIPTRPKKKSYTEELVDFSMKLKRGEVETASVVPKKGQRLSGGGKEVLGSPVAGLNTIGGIEQTVRPRHPSNELDDKGEFKDKPRGNKQSKRSQRNQNTAPQRKGTKKLVGGAMGNVRARIQTPIVTGVRADKPKPSDKNPPQTRRGQQRSAKRRVKLEVVRRSFITFEKIDLDPFETSNENDPVGRGHGKKLPDKVNSKKLGVEKPTHKPSMPTIKPAKRVGTSTMGLGSGAGRPITQANNREWFSEVYGL